MNDTIYRRDAIQALVDTEEIKGFAYRMLKDRLIEIPSADKQQGEWKHLKGDEWLCSNCGHVVWTEGSWEHPLERGKDYCEHCGAMMSAKDINVPNKEGKDDDIDYTDNH